MVRRTCATRCMCFEVRLAKLVRFGGISSARCAGVRAQLISGRIRARSQHNQTDLNTIYRHEFGSFAATRDAASTQTVQGYLEGTITSIRLDIHDEDGWIQVIPICPPVVYQHYCMKHLYLSSSPCTCSDCLEPGQRHSGGACAQPVPYPNASLHKLQRFRHSWRQRL